MATRDSKTALVIVNFHRFTTSEVEPVSASPSEADCEFVEELGSTLSVGVYSLCFLFFPCRLLFVLFLLLGFLPCLSQDSAFLQAPSLEKEIRNRMDFVSHGVESAGSGPSDHTI